MYLVATCAEQPVIVFMVDQLVSYVVDNVVRVEANKVEVCPLLCTVTH